VSLHLRSATIEDLPGLLARVPGWARAFATPDYLPADVETSLRDAFGPDARRVGEGTWYVVLATTGEPVACGGWSRVEDAQGSERPLDPASEPARILSTFIAPDHARAGLGGVLLARCESEAAQAGFQACGLLATPPAIALYESYGYAPGSPDLRRLPGGIEVRLVPMRKALVTS
jgi:GNAT superfamily N-acetyltransferase